MRHFIRRCLALTLVAGLVAVPFVTAVTAQEIGTVSEKEGTDPGLMAFDLLLVRPAGIGATILGTLVFVVALPFSLAAGNTGETFDNLMKTPAQYTFHRPLGYL